MVICGCPPENEIAMPARIQDLCPVASKPSPIINIETKSEIRVNSCYNNIALGFSSRHACGGMDCGE